MYLVFFGCVTAYQAFAYLVIIFGFDFKEKEKDTTPKEECIDANPEEALRQDY